MKTRIGIWACTGALVVLSLSLIFIAFRGMIHTESALWPIVYVVCPISLFRHHAMSMYLVLLVNTGTYALAGLIFESMRRRFASHST
jgi:hypothetical protein